MAKKTIGDLRPNDIVWSLHGETIEAHYIFSISTKEIVTQTGFTLKLQEGDLTSWKFMAKNRYDTIQEFHLNRIDVLKQKHIQLENLLKDTYERQQQYFDTIINQNKLIYDSNIEIINELKKSNG